MAEHNLTDQVQNLYDATVYDQDGDKIGGVAQVYLDDHSGQPSWATVKTGWFGTKETFVPLDDARIEGDRIDVPYTKEFVKDAPNIDAELHLDGTEEGGPLGDVEDRESHHHQHHADGCVDGLPGKQEAERGEHHEWADNPEQDRLSTRDGTLSGKCHWDDHFAPPFGRVESSGRRSRTQSTWAEVAPRTSPR